MYKIVRQDISFGMTLPETGNANMTTTISFGSPGGLIHCFSVTGLLPKMLAGPVTVTVDTMLTVAEPPPPSLRERLIALLGDTQDCGVASQAAAVLELLSERPNLLAELEELASEDDD